MRSLLGTLILVVDFFPFSTLNISCHSLPASRVSAERSTVIRMVFPLYVTCCFSLATFNILSLCLVFVSLILCVLACFSLGLSCMGLFVPLELDYFLFHVGEIFNYNLFENFLIPFIFYSFSGTHIIWMLVCLMLSQKSLRLSSVLFTFFTLFCSSKVVSATLSSRSLICSSASDILLLIPSRIFLISVIVLFFLYVYSLILLGLC